MNIYLQVFLKSEDLGALVSELTQMRDKGVPCEPEKQHPVRNAEGHYLGYWQTVGKITP
jgi:hypothetical protein